MEGAGDVKVAVELVACDAGTSYHEFLSGDSTSVDVPPSAGRVMIETVGDSFSDPIPVDRVEIHGGHDLFGLVTMTTGAPGCVVSFDEVATLTFITG